MDKIEKPLSRVLGGINERLHHVEGICDEHGAATVLTRREAAWHCPKCVEQKMADERRNEWLAERNNTLMKIAQIPVKYEGKSFVASTPAMKAVRSQAKMFRDFIVNEKRWATLVLVGTTGTGKTLMACEFAQSLIRNLSLSVRYSTANGMIKEIQGSYGREGKSEDTEIARFVQYDLLIIDEIDAKADKENANLLLNEVINRRYMNERPVIIITNQAFDNLAQYVGDRVDSRLHENAFVCAFDWEDARRAGHASR